METRARYALIGLFTVAVIVAVFAFVYWLENSGGLRERAAYRVRFENPVSGLLVGSAVLFNGIRVGEVTGLGIEASNPEGVMARIEVDRATPVRADTVIGIQYQGLTGGAVISLVGGSATAPAAEASDGGTPLLIADPVASQDWTQVARDVLQRMGAILSDNAEPLHSAIGNIETFSGVLARNADRIDGILAGLERMTGGSKPKGPIPVYDLIPPHDFTATEKPLPGQILIPDPTVLLAFNTDKIQIEQKPGQSTPLPDAQWSDNLPNLFQEKIIQSFENAGFAGSVGRRMDNFDPDYQLALDIRAFHIVAEPSRAAEVAFTAKLLGQDGKIAEAKLFHATAPAKAAEPGPSVEALNAAFANAAKELVTWTVNTVAALPPPPPPAPNADMPMPPAPSDGSAVPPAMPESVPGNAPAPPPGDTQAK